MYVRNCEVKPGIVFPENMHRIALGVEYRGDMLNGFQKQRSTANTVQSYLEAALSNVANEDISLVCAGRTDAGVHATGQIVHFDTAANRPNRAWVLGVNTKLPETIRVHWASTPGPEFHARFSAQSRIYRYFIYNGPVIPATLAKQVTAIRYSLDFKRMADASKVLVGSHDFSAFRSSQCQASNALRAVHRIDWVRQGALVYLEIQANAFLHHMVRNIVGSLFDIGRGKRDKQWLENVLCKGDRCLAGSTAPPWGLYLVGVDFDKRFNLPVLNSMCSRGPFFVGRNEPL